MKKIFVICFLLILTFLPVHAENATSGNDFSKNPKEIMTGSITIHYAEENKIYSIKNVLSGEEVFKGKPDKDKIISVSGLPKGTYKLVGKNISPCYITLPLTMQKEEAKEFDFHETEGIPDASGNIQIWDPHYKVIGDHVEMSSSNPNLDLIVNFIFCLPAIVSIIGLLILLFLSFF